MNILWAALPLFVTTSAFAEINQIHYKCEISVNNEAYSSSADITLKRINGNVGDTSFKGVGMTASGEVVIMSRTEFHTDVNNVFHKEAYQTQTNVGIISGAHFREKSIRDLRRNENISADFLPVLSTKVNCQYISEQ